MGREAEVELAYGGEIYWIAMSCDANWAMARGWCQMGNLDTIVVYTTDLDIKKKKKQI